MKNTSFHRFIIKGKAGDLRLNGGLVSGAKQALSDGFSHKAIPSKEVTLRY